jgi:hypothetical protein
MNSPGGKLKWTFARSRRMIKNEKRFGRDVVSVDDSHRRRRGIYNYRDAAQFELTSQTN